MSTETVIEHYILDQVLLGRRDVKIDPDQHLVDTGLIDSMGMMMMIVYLEEQFDIQIADDELLPENFSSIARIKAFVEGRRQQVR